MTMVEREEQLRSLGSQKGRSASICVGASSSMESVMAPGQQPQPMHAAARMGSRGNVEEGSASSTPRSRRRVGAARSQSARVVGSRPRVNKRRSERQQSPHLDLAGSEPYIGEGEESYNPFLRKVPSTGRLLGESQSPEDSPVAARRPSSMALTREKPPVIPVIATPESSPAPSRRPSSALPTSPCRLPPTGLHDHKRANSFKNNSRKPSFLDVPDGSGNHHNGHPEDEAYLLRSFSFTSKGGVVNRGDSFRRRRSRSNSLIPQADGGAASDIYGNSGKTDTPPPSQTQALTPLVPIRDVCGPSVRLKPFDTFQVAMMGAQGVGKTTLISQFMTSECINAYDRQRDDESQMSVCVMLNGEESELNFVAMLNPKDKDNGRGRSAQHDLESVPQVELSRANPPDAFVVMYSVIDKASFQRAESELERLQDYELLRSRAVILVGNKVDLVRSRAVSTQDGKCLACTYRVKFVEISVGINHNVDELLVGILNQIRLKFAQDRSQLERDSQHWYKSRGVVRASMKARQVFTWLFGKEDSKFKNCENLHVL